MDNDKPAAQSAQRRTERVLIQVPIEVKGNDADGRVFRETTRTVVINRDGARIALRHTLRQDSRISITNLQSRKTCSFRVVGRVQQTIGIDPEWGVECLSADPSFWGVLFPNRVAAQPPKEMVDVLLECIVCRTRELAQLSLASYRKLVEKSLIALKCETCKDSSEWRLCFIEEEAGGIGAPAPAEKRSLKGSGIERRMAKRLTAKLPLRLRKSGNVEEITRTENLSKTGVCFYSKLEILTGEEIHLTVGYSEGTPGNEVRAKIVWGRAVGGNEQFLYGAQLAENS